jgi:hypothetical protein
MQIVHLSTAPKQERPKQLTARQKLHARSIVLIARLYAEDTIRAEKKYKK